MTRSTPHTPKIPKLRFPGFVGEWEKKEFGDLYDFINTNSLSRAKLEYGVDGIKNIHYGDIHTKLNNNFDSKNQELPTIQNEFLPNNIEDYFCKVGDLVIADASEDYEYIGRSIEIINLGNDKIVGGLHTFLARPKIKLGLGFFSSYMKNQKLHKKIKIIANGAKVLGISKINLSKISLYIPKLPEQQKIADFLSLVDEKIEYLEEEKKSLEEYKKGMMQKIFSQEVRFTDENGESFGEWEEKRLGNSYEIVVGGTPSTSNKSFWNGNIPWLSSGEINHKFINGTKKYITELGLAKSAAKMMPIGTVLLAMTGATLGKIGFLNIESTGNQSVAGFVPNKSNAPKFLFYALEFYKNLILSFGAGAAQPGVNKSTIENMIFDFPTLPEQQKIADFLSGLDDKIESVENEIDGTKEWKKGLLQGLFF